MPHVNRKVPEEKMRFGILTVSDTCFKQANVDKSGPQIKALIKGRYTDSIVIYEDIVPDELEQIKQKLINWCDDMCDVVFTTGGTGIADRDVTPEATKAVIDKEVPGISFVMMNKSLASTPFAMLSRAIAGIRKKTLIINFPGSVKAVTENFEAICDIIPHAISLLQNKFEDIQKIHSRMVHLPMIQPKPENLTGLNLAPSNVVINTVANRPRASPYEMVTVDNALGIVTMNCGRKSDAELLPIVLPNIMGRVLAEDVRSRDALPPFNASIKDGYAVKSSDGAGLRNVVDVKAAGDNPEAQELQSGECIRISTGAPVPAGADAVVQVEDTELVKSSEDSSKELQINIKVAPKPGQDIKAIGSDIPAHSIVLQKGNVLNAAEVGVLAAVGQTQAKVFKPRRLHKRSNLNQESKDVVKNVIFYFDQQKNAGGFLFPIEKPTEAAAAAAGIARSTVVKMRKEIKNEVSQDEPEIEFLDIEDQNKNNDSDLEVEKPESPNKKMKTRVKRTGEANHRKMRKQKFVTKPKEGKTSLNSSRIKIITDNITGTHLEGSAVIEIRDNNNIIGMKRKSTDTENQVNKRIRLVTKKNDEFIDNLDEQIKIITNDIVDPITKSAETTRTASPTVKRIIIDAKNNEIISESLSKISTTTGAGKPKIKRIRIEANKNAFLSESCAKLAAAAGVDASTIKLIKKEVLNDSSSPKHVLGSDKELPIVRIVKKNPVSILKKPADFKLISKEALAAIKSPKINILRKNHVLIQKSPETSSNKANIPITEIKAESPKPASVKIEIKQNAANSCTLTSALSNDEAILPITEIENDPLFITTSSPNKCLTETV